MRTIAAIRTHKWTEAEARLLAHLRAGFGDDVCVVFHNRPAEIMPPCDVVDLTEAWVDAQALRRTDDWGWRCGDYSYYALRMAKPGYDFYWLVEPDVHFTGKAGAFFSRFDGVATDVLGLDPKPMEPPNHRFTGSVAPFEPWRAIFALTRMSGGAIEALFEKRRENSAMKIKDRRYANDEIFVFTMAKNTPDLSMGSLRDHAETWFADGIFATAPDFFLDALDDDPALADKVCHPVLDRTDFINEMVRRVSRVRYLVRGIHSFDHFSDDDLVEIADLARDRLLTRLRDLKAEMESAAAQEPEHSGEDA